MVLATPLGTVYPGAQLDSGLRCGCGYSSGSGYPCCSLALGNPCLPTGSSCSGRVGLNGMQCYREVVVGKCPAAEFGAGWALFGAGNYL